MAPRDNVGFHLLCRSARFIPMLSLFDHEVSTYFIYFVFSVDINANLAGFINSIYVELINTLTFNFYRKYIGLPAFELYQVYALVFSFLSPVYGPKLNPAEGPLFYSYGEYAVTIYLLSHTHTHTHIYIYIYICIYLMRSWCKDYCCGK